MASTQDETEFEDLVDFIRSSRGFDFTGYKRPSLDRRIQKRMQAVKIPTYGEYRHFLEQHPDEFIDLFNTILINVTAFFRDRAAWDYLAPRDRSRGSSSDGRERADPRLVRRLRDRRGGLHARDAARRGAGPTRVPRRASRSTPPTSTTRRSTTAAHGALHGEAGRAGPGELRERYFERAGRPFVFRTDLRRSVIFGRHDLVQDPPISRIDLLVCRNTLMYFDAETQSGSCANFHFALADDGYLFLGKSEVLLARSALFAPFDLKRRVFREGRRCRRAPTRRPRADAARRPPERPASTRRTARRAASSRRRSRSSSSTAAAASRSCNTQARALFGLSPRDVGQAAPATSSSRTGRSSCARASSRRTRERRTIDAARRRVARRRGRVAATSTSTCSRCVEQRREAVGVGDLLHRRDALPAASGRARDRSASSRPPTRSCSRPSRSSRRRTRSCSRRTRSSRRRTKSSSRRTKSSRR